MKTLVAEGIVPCRICKRPHNAYRTEGSKLWGSWESQDDGHVYYKMSAEEVVALYELRIGAIRAVHEHGGALERLSDA